VLTLILLLALAAIASIEFWLRFGIGLGNPPLYQLHPDIEYLPVPGVYRRFGNTITCNRAHMRGPDFPLKKTDPNELRILVIGDSIVHAGVRVDDAHVATVVLEETLRARLSRPVRVMNVGASSWGPLNQLAYVRTFGVFDADAAILVYNCSDMGDGFPPPPGTPMLGYEHPQRRPILAIQEVLEKYVPRYLGLNPSPVTHDTTNPPEPIAAYNRRLVGDLVAVLREMHIPVSGVVQWMESEIRHGPRPGTVLAREILHGFDVPLVETRDTFARASAGGEQVFLPRDEAHPSVAGQRLLAGCYEAALQAAAPGLLIPVPSKGR